MSETSSGNIDISKDRVLADYRLAVRAREVDKAEAAIKASGKAMFCILGAGQEIPQIVGAKELREGDWLRGYYRGGAEALAAGVVTVRQMIAQVLGDTGNGNDLASGGRMMGRHFGSRLLDADGNLIDLTKQVNRASDVSSTGSQMPVALGLALASNLFAEVPELASYDTLSKGGKEVALVSIGDSAMAEGTSYATIAQAVTREAPLVVSAFNNGYGISVPADRQIPHGSPAKALAGFAPQTEGGKGLKIMGPVKGWEYFNTRKAYDEAFRWARERRLPALVEALVTQPMGHSSSGDHRAYKSPDRMRYEEENDGIARMRTDILQEGIATENELLKIEEEERDYVEQESKNALEDFHSPLRNLVGETVGFYRSLKNNLPRFSEMIDGEISSLTAKLDIKHNPVLSRADIVRSLRKILVATRDYKSCPERTTLVHFYEQILADVQERYSSHVYAEGDKSPINQAYKGPEYKGKLGQDSNAHIIAAGLATLMQADPRIVMYGEDTGKIGGVTTCTLGLQGGHEQILSPVLCKTMFGKEVPQPEKEEILRRVLEQNPALAKYIPQKGFGKDRVDDFAITEETIVGSAVGMALRGLRPVIEVQYHDYLVWALQQMTDELSSLRHRTDGGQEAPVLIRVHGHQLVGMWHSGSPMGQILSSCPGLRVLTPRNGVQAVGMYRALLKSRDPAVSIEPLASLYQKEEVPDNLDEICIPLGHSEVLKEGEHVTIITYGQSCHVAMEAAKKLEEMGINVEVVDLQTLSPLDINNVAKNSIKKTGKVLFVDEDIPNGAIPMISKTLLGDTSTTENALFHAEEIGHITAPEHKPPYGADGKYFCKPQAEDIQFKICEMMGAKIR